MAISINTFFKKRWLAPTIAVILGMLFLARLGIWQLDRLEWRRGENEKKSAAINAEAISLNGNIADLNLLEMRNYKVTAAGMYDFDEQFIVKSQPYQGRQGSYLLTPLQLEGQNTAVLVNRGWIPVADEVNTAQFDERGSQQVNGRIQLTETLSGGRVTEITADNEVFRIDVQAIAQELPYPILPIYILEEPTDNDNLPYQLEADLSLDEGSHLSYAIQWFSFSVLLGVIFVYYVNKAEQTAADSSTS
ncbi:MAG: SURF1 family protein [Anaerolineales bacterium]|nr:SURF1 family protein [Anaerolineales bacterium]